MACEGVAAAADVDDSWPQASLPRDESEDGWATLGLATAPSTDMEGQPQWAAVAMDVALTPVKERKAGVTNPLPSGRTGMGKWARLQQAEELFGGHTHAHGKGLNKLLSDEQGVGSLLPEKPIITVGHFVWVLIACLWLMGLLVLGGLIPLGSEPGDTNITHHEQAEIGLQAVEAHDAVPMPMIPPLTPPLTPTSLSQQQLGRIAPFPANAHSLSAAPPLAAGHPLPPIAPRPPPARSPPPLRSPLPLRSPPPACPLPVTPSAPPLSPVPWERCYAQRYSDLLRGYCSGVLAECNLKGLRWHWDHVGSTKGLDRSCTELQLPPLSAPPPPHKPLAQPPQACHDWCVDLKKGWLAKCEFLQCGGCKPCLQL